MAIILTENHVHTHHLSLDDDEDEDVWGDIYLWRWPKLMNPEGQIGIKVSPEGKGLGTILLSALLSRVGDRPLYAYILKTNTASQRLFAKHGFVRTPHRPHEDIWIRFPKPRRT